MQLFEEFFTLPTKRDQRTTQNSLTSIQTQDLDKCVNPGLAISLTKAAYLVKAGIF